jgi:hypothetical protein
MPRGSTRAALTLLLLTLVSASGCGGDGRQAVWGTVSFRGEPLDNAVIEFVPVAGPGGRAAPARSGADIHGGKYSIPKKQGLAPGKYRVLISKGIQQEATGEAAPAPAAGKGPSLDSIPRKYNEGSKQIVEVKEGEKNEFDFSIP